MSAVKLTGPFRIRVGEGQQDWCSMCGGQHGGKGVQFESELDQAVRFCASCVRLLRRLLRKPVTNRGTMTGAVPVNATIVPRPGAR